MTRTLTLPLALLVAATLVPACASSNSSKRAATNAGHSDIPVMTWDEAKAAQDNGAVLVDARGADSYEAGHIPGAILASVRDDQAVSKLPADKNVQLVTYCGGPQCNASNTLASRAVAAGYTKVAEYKGGFPEWASKHGLSKEATDRPAHEGVTMMSWDEVASAMASGAVLVDARGSEGYAKGHIEGAVNVPYKDEGAYASLPEDKSTALIFYCGGPACSASTKGATTALSQGYTNVAEYRGGYPEWASKQ